MFGVIVNLSLLIYFKFLPFLSQNFNLILKSLGYLGWMRIQHQEAPPSDHFVAFQRTVQASHS